MTQTPPRRRLLYSVLITEPWLLPPCSSPGPGYLKRSMFFCVKSATMRNINNCTNQGRMAQIMEKEAIGNTFRENNSSN
jgi:hypothetical protein